MKIISYVLYGKHKLYNNGAYLNAIMAKEYYPDFEVWIYGGFDVPEEYISQYTSFPFVKYITINTNQSYLKCYRYIPIDNKNVSVCFSRDADSRVTKRDQWCINEFLKNIKIVTKTFISVGESWYVVIIRSSEVHA